MTREQGLLGYEVHCRFLLKRGLLSKIAVKIDIDRAVVGQVQGARVQIGAGSVKYADKRWRRKGCGRIEVEQPGTCKGVAWSLYADSG